METCNCCGANQPARKMDDDGRCPTCHALAEQIRVRMENGDLLSPENPSPLQGGQQIPLDPRPAPKDRACDACSRVLGEDQYPYSSQGREFYVHGRCWKVILTL